VSGWGPQQTNVGEGFNLQPSGGSAFWVRIDCDPATTLIRFGKRELEPHVRHDRITVSFEPDAAIEKPCQIPGTLFDPISGEVLPLGQLKVLSK
jgi:hypothetical protein